MSNSRADWHLVVTAPRREKSAMDALKRQGIESFCPEFTRRYRKMKAGKPVVKEKELPLFPGYIFVQRPEVMPSFSRFGKGQAPSSHLQKGAAVSGLELVEWLADIEQTDGIYSFVRFGAYPIVVPDRIVNDLRHAMALGCFVEDEKTGKVGYLGTDAAQSWRNEPERDPFVLGTKVMIVDGPFASFVASILEASVKDRIKVILNVFGRETEVSLEKAQVEVLT